MSITALVFLVVYFGGLALAFKNPIWGLGAYMWAFYNHPPSRWWAGEVPNIRWSLIAAIVTAVAFVVHSAMSVKPRADDGGAGSDRTPLNAGLVLLVMLTAWMWIQSAWAVDPEAHFEGCMLFTKYVMLFFIIERLIRTEQYLEMLAWAHVGGCFIWGWIAYTSDVNGRAELDLGPGVGDSNTLGFHLVTALAMGGLMVLGLAERRRFLLLGVLPFIMNAVILTASRGATLAMVAAGVGSLLFAPRAKTKIIWAGAALGGVLFMALAGSDLFWARMNTISPSALSATDESEAEGSAYSRIVVARANWRMAADHPLGAGYRGNVALSPDYVEKRWLTKTEGVRAAHNTFLAVLVDEGIFGLIILVALLGWSTVRLCSLKRLDRYGLPASIGTYRAGIAAGLIAYIVAGQFGNFITAEVGIWLLAMVAATDALPSVQVCRGAIGRKLTAADRGAARSAGASAPFGSLPATRTAGYSQRSPHLFNTISDQTRR